MSDEATKRAKAWGKAHGYYWMPGGWVYREGKERPVCQGWYQLYQRIGREIDRWYEAQKAQKQVDKQ